jgi:hypothetical protein
MILWGEASAYSVIYLDSVRFGSCLVLLSCSARLGDAESKRFRAMVAYRVET